MAGAWRMSGSIARKTQAAFHTSRSESLSPRQVHREERAMASPDGGHIARADQRVLNRQENAISRQIGR